MKIRYTFLLASSLLVLQINSTHSLATDGRSLRALANRVDQVDKTNAICEASIPEDKNAPTGVTHITFYYSVESNEPVTYSIMQNLDRMLYYAIGDAVLWCSQSTNTEDNARRLQVHDFNPKSKFLIWMLRHPVC